ncbi:phage portal protein [Isoptericola sp. NPDC056134]|uniref:phage portal protein n=1 Tax=Isoptericola sp. NPDC056134 TaxID=3345723 RepID=UPI0035E877BD
MAFVVSDGALRALDRTPLPSAYSLRVTSDYTMAYAEIWRTQPAVRTVVSFLGRNIAQLGLHTYRRLSDNDRERLTGHPLSALISRPAPWTTRYRLLDALVQDMAIYDVAYWLKLKAADSSLALARLAPQRTEVFGTGGLFPDGFRYTGDRGKRDFPRDEVVHFHGYNPTDEMNGAPPIEALRRILAEEWEAGRMREQTLRNGARASGYLERPADAPSWSDEARQRFRAGWKAQYSGGGPEAGGTPVLEDGMKFVSASQTAEQLQYVAARKLTREEVAATFHIPPPMVGILDHATFGNIEEQHKMLYADTLGPWLTMIQEEIGLQLLPDFGDATSVYVEFNLAEKLRGSFEEQAAALQTSVGAPWLTRNEARARQNLPQVEGGDELVTPLNVLIGGQSSATDSAPEPVKMGPVLRKDSPTAPLRIKAQAATEHEKAAQQVLVRFFKRQRAAVLSALGAKADGAEWWDEERWNDELSTDLLALSMSVTAAVGAETLKGLGIDPDQYSEGQTVAFLKAVASSRAGAINSTTRDQIKAALAASTAPAHVFDVAETSRAEKGGTTLATTLAAFAVTEAAKQVGRPQTTKTWVVTSSNPRSSHAAMAGETVPIDGTFSNGMEWPGDPVAGAEEVANCMCSVEITIP